MKAADLSAVSQPMRLASALAAAAAVAALIGVSPASADIYRFDVMDPAVTLGGQPFQNYFFFIDNSMVPARYDADTFSYNVIDFGQTFSPVNVFDTVTFYDSAKLGGFANTFTTTFEQGPQAFQGSTSAPLFQNATYRYDTDQPNGGETLQVTDISAPPPVSAAPEPSTWVLMFAGVAMLGAMLRFGRRRQGAPLAA